VVAPRRLLETGETLLEAGRREVREELGVEVEVQMLFKVSEEIVRDAKGRARFHSVLVDFLARLSRRARITLNGESEALKWFRVEEVEGLDVSDNTRRIVEKYRAEGPRGDSPH
jgi:8-oxo-dGTP diphosphatase